MGPGLSIHVRGSWPDVGRPGGVIVSDATGKELLVQGHSYSSAETAFSVLRSTDGCCRGTYLDPEDHEPADLSRITLELNDSRVAIPGSAVTVPLEPE